MHYLREGVLGKLTRRVSCNRRDPHEHGVICHSIEVQWLRELHIEPGRMLYRLSPSKPIRITRCRQGTEGVGVKRISGVYVQITKIRIAVRVRIGCCPAINNGVISCKQRIVEPRRALIQIGCLLPTVTATGS